MNTKAKCEAFAQEHNITITIDRWKEWGSWHVSYSVDLPNGLITEAGNTGLCGESEDCKMSEVWEAVWGSMQELTHYDWIAVEQPDDVVVNDDAERMIREAMIEHGTPNWVASVPSSVRRSVPAERIAELREQYATLSESVANRRDTKHDLIDEWCKDNVFEEVTLADLARIGNCSKEFARQKTINRPDIFRRLTRTTYEIRDPQADRR